MKGASGASAAALLGFALVIGCTAPMAMETSGLPKHPYWERPIPIPLQGPALPVPPGAEIVADLSADACGTCHPAQLTAWRESLHAAAVSPGLLGQIGAFGDATQDDCLSCHAPRQKMVQQWWDQGLADADSLASVDCTTCHVRGHVRHGPVRELPLFRQAEFCAPCHQFDDTGLTVNGKPLENTYVEWRQSRYARDGVTCQNCHMPEKLHVFKGIHHRESTRQGLSVRGWRTREELRVLAGNTGAGHALPTYVTPRIVIRLEGTGGRTVKEHVIARRMRWSREQGWVELADDRLFPDQWITLKLALPEEQGGRVSVHVEPDYDYHERVYPALLAMLADDLSVEERALLQQAREQTGTTAYRLYRLDCPEWNGHDAPCNEKP